MSESMPPTNPTVSYPRPTGPEEDIDFKVLSEAWGYFASNPWPYVLGGLMMMLPGLLVVGLAVAVMFGAMVAMFSDSPIASFGGSLLLSGFSVPINFVTYFFVGPILASFARMLVMEMQGRQAQIDDIWWGYREGFFTFGIAYGIVSAAVAVGMLFCYIPAFVIGGLAMGVVPAMALKKLSLSDAIKESIEVFKQNWIMAGVMYLVLVLLMGIGTLACGVGFFATMPFAYMAMNLVYIRAAERRGAEFVIED